MRFFVAVIVLTTWLPMAAAEHGSPGDNLHQHYDLPQFGYLILAGGNGITTDMWHLVKYKRRLVATKDGRKHVVPLKLLAAYDREVPDFSSAGGYGENIVVLRPSRRLKPDRTYTLQVRRRVAKRWTWKRVSTFTLSLIKPSTAGRLQLVASKMLPRPKTDPSPVIAVNIRGGSKGRVWLRTRVTRMRNGRRSGRPQTRHIAIAPLAAMPHWLGHCAFHPIAGRATRSAKTSVTNSAKTSAKTNVAIQFRVADSRGQRTRWSKPITMPPHGQLNICVLKVPVAGAAIKTK